MIPLLRILKIPDSAVLGDKSGISGGEPFRREIDLSHHDLQRNFSSDTRVAFVKERGGCKLPAGSARVVIIGLLVSAIFLEPRGERAGCNMVGI